MSHKSRDLELAYKVHEEVNCLGITENAVIPNHIKDRKNYKPRTLVDETLEYIDPTPNIYTLFVQFNAQFFWNALLPVEVKWSNRMTSCAGVCSYHPRNRQCIISLSLPLLKLRPRKDLIETLLHEMIHGYLFLTNNDRDRDGHGPQFCKHMHRINKEAGTNITIYHDFHEEVRLYKQHWWRCNGPCQNKAPYFGTVRRSMNRAPGPSDFWWKEHQRTCNGHFIKIKEPEKIKANGSKKAGNNKTKPASKGTPNKNISDWLKGVRNSVATSTPKPTIPKSLGDDNGVQNNISSTANNLVGNSNTKSQGKDTAVAGIKKLGSTTNNVHGWGTGGPGASKNTQKSARTDPDSPKYSFSGTLGGGNLSRSNLLDKYKNVGTSRRPSNINKPSASIKSIRSQVTNKDLNPFVGVKDSLVNCPICQAPISEDVINHHIDMCLINENSTNSLVTNKPVPTESHGNSNKTPPKKRTKLTDAQDNDSVYCPACNEQIKYVDRNIHRDHCLFATSKNVNDIPQEIILDSNNHTNNSIIVISSPSSSEGSTPATPRRKKTGNNERETHEDHKCLVCNTVISSTISLSDHLEECIGSVFNDESTNFSDNEFLDASEVRENIDTSIEGNKYPCPVCMQLTDENIMNDHLDKCLSIN